MRMRKVEGEHGGGQGHDGGGPLRWLLTYADMITLLMAFFIMMYSMSILNLAKFREVAFSIRSGFAGVVPGQGRSILRSDGQFSIKPSVVPGDTAGVPWRVVRPLQEFIRSDPLLSRNARMFTDERGLVISLVSDAALFHSGGAVLRPESHPLLNRIAAMLKQIPNNLWVEGHTCDLPMKGDRYPSNWELSCARATNVVRYLIEQAHVPAKRITAVGHAGLRPLVPNDSPRHRRMNRRVDIVILRPPASRPV